MGKQMFKYVLVCMGTYMSMAAVEIFLLKPLVDFFGTDFWTHLLVYAILLLVVNPVITKIITNKIDFVYKQTTVKEDGQ